MRTVRVIGTVKNLMRGEVVKLQMLRQEGLFLGSFLPCLHESKASPPFPSLELQVPAQ